MSLFLYPLIQIISTGSTNLINVLQTTGDSLSLPLPYSLKGVPSKEYMLQFFYPKRNEVGLLNDNHRVVTFPPSDTIPKDMRGPLLETLPKSLINKTDIIYSAVLQSFYNKNLITAENFQNQNTSELFSISGYVTRLGEVAPYARVMLYDKVTGQLLRQQITREDGFFMFSDIRKDLAPFVVSFDRKNEMNPEIISKISAQ